MGRIKVLFTIDSLGTGGTESSTLDVISSLPDTLEPSLVYFHPKEDLLLKFKALGITVHRISLRGHNDWIGGSKKLAAYLTENKIDVVISTLYEANIISRLACRKTGIPLIGTFVTDSYGAVRRSSFSGINKLKFLYTEYLDRFTASIPKLYISNGAYIGSTNAKWLRIPSSKIHVVYRGRNLALFPEWREPTSTDFTFITIARLVENKGLFELIEAFEQVHKSHPETKLLLAGDGPLRPKLQKLVEQKGLSGSIALKGNVPNAYNLLYQSHVFVLATWFEGFSGALIEAMLSGIPVMASNIPMNAEAIRDKENGRLFEVKNAIDLARIMNDVINNYSVAKLQGQIARKEAIKLFDAAQRGKIYSDLIDSVLI